jgi:heterodisulfide reductase subunit B
MKVALFLGCNIPARVPQYEVSARAVLGRLEVDVVDVREFNCCGYPLRNMDLKAYLLFSARNLALAEKKELPVMTLCQCCFGSLKKADHLLKTNSDLREEMNGYLKKEGLSFQGKIEVKHLLTVLHKDIGISRLKEKISSGFKNLKIATHYGCHVLRPSDVMQFDNPVAPVLFDQLVTITGAKSVDWPLKLECCGAPVRGVNDRLSMDLTEKKLNSGKAAGADYLCVACPWCHLQFDSVQRTITQKQNTNHPLTSVVFPQLLGLAMGISKDALGMDQNQTDVSKIDAFLSQE